MSENQNVIEHPRIITSHTAIRINHGKAVTRLLMVRTDVALRPKDPNFDKEAYHDLLDTVGRYQDDHGTDEVHIEQVARPAGPGASPRAAKVA